MNTLNDSHSESSYVKCEKCGYTNHTTDECKNELSTDGIWRRNLKDIKCNKCKLFGHYSNKCTKNNQDILVLLNEVFNNTKIEYDKDRKCEKTRISDDDIVSDLKQKIFKMQKKEN